MKELAKTKVVPQGRRRSGRPKKILDLQKLDNVNVAVPESAAGAIESLLIFDARGLEQQTQQELLRILPELAHIRRAWKAHFLENGCVSCHKKQAEYAAGGFCVTCHRRILTRMRNRYRKLMAGRDLPAELATFKNALCLRYNAAQQLFNEEDTLPEELSPENIDFLDEQRRSLRPYDISKDSLVDLCVRIVRQLHARGKLSLEPEHLRTLLTTNRIGGQR